MRITTPSRPKATIKGHNFGLVLQHLSSLLATLSILSLLFHTLLELLDDKYQLLRVHLPKRQTFFDDLHRVNPLSVLRQLGAPSELYA
jgi:hypothetical protein